MCSHGYNAIFNMDAGASIAGGDPTCGDIGGTRFFGLLMGQNQNALIAFDTLFKALEQQNTPVNSIIELGTSHGGLSVFLQLYSLSRGVKFITYDYHGFVPTYANIFELLQVDYRQADVLNDPATTDEIAQLIATHGVSVVLCDNGNKIREFAKYSAYLKSGDLILAHDYAPDTATFVQDIKDKIWSFHEITDADIVASCEQHGLEPYLQEIMGQAAWVCRRKR